MVNSRAKADGSGKSGKSDKTGKSAKPGDKNKDKASAEEKLLPLNKNTFQKEIALKPDTTLTINHGKKSDLGISLCYTHFGRIYDKQGKTAEAIAEYRKAYEIMKPSGDRWHTMEPCLALAEGHLKTGRL